MPQFGRSTNPEHTGIRHWETKQGGSKSVHWSIGTNRCWCGQELDHDWPGKAEKAPHPREET